MNVIIGAKRAARVTLSEYEDKRPTVSLTIEASPRSSEGSGSAELDRAAAEMLMRALQIWLNKSHEPPKPHR